MVLSFALWLMVMEDTGVESTRNYSLVPQILPPLQAPEVRGGRGNVAAVTSTHSGCEAALLKESTVLMTDGDTIMVSFKALCLAPVNQISDYHAAVFLVFPPVNTKH